MISVNKKKWVLTIYLLILDGCRFFLILKIPKDAEADELAHRIKVPVVTDPDIIIVQPRIYFSHCRFVCIQHILDFPNKCHRGNNRWNFKMGYPIIGQGIGLIFLLNGNGIHKIISIILFSVQIPINPEFCVDHHISMKKWLGSFNGKLNFSTEPISERGIFHQG